jgi:predicted GNAT family acetyltransferase
MQIGKPRPHIINNQTANQFELSTDGTTALLTYRLRPDAIVFVHTEVPEKLEGRGLGKQVAQAGLDFARSEGLKVVPICPFIAGYIKRHQEYLDIVREDYRERMSAKKK